MLLCIHTYTQNKQKEILPYLGKEKGSSMVLIPKTCEYVTLHGKRDVASVIKLGVLRWGSYRRLLWWIQCNHKDSYKRKPRRSVWEAIRDVRNRGHRNVEPQAKECRQSLEGGKGKERIHLESPEGILISRTVRG